MYQVGVPAHQCVRCTKCAYFLFKYAAYTLVCGRDTIGLVMTIRKTDYTVFRSSAGFGLKATKDYKKGDTVIEYVGEKITDAEADERANRYLFEINNQWTIDGSPRYNLARYINHSCQPNCEAVLDEEEERVYIDAKRAIKAGEELTYDYGKNHFEEYIKPGGCKCTKCSS